MTDAGFRIVIPARYASTRLPGKALADVAGRPLVQRVHECAVASSAAEVVIATDDERIAAAGRAFGADVVMTRADHASGTDRVAEAAEQRGWPDDTIVVNVQGDLPCLPPVCIDQVAELLCRHPQAGIATLCSPIQDEDEYHDPNAAKVVFDHSGRALYFSRAPIPSVLHSGSARPGSLKAWRHIGLYGYRVATLKLLTAARPCDLELHEKLEQLRALWLGIEIRVGVAAAAHGPDVDTAEDLERAVRAVRERA